MKFGVVLPHHRDIASAAALRQVAEEAESQGFDSVWVQDHIIVANPYVERFGEKFYDPIPLLGFLAAITEKVKIGTSFLVLPYRNPVFTAKVVATVDDLTHGRFIFGVGVGWCREEFEYLGVSFEERGKIVDETLRMCMELWESDTPSFQGDYWHFGDLIFEPKPVQKPHPPIWVGGNSRRGRRRAIEFGDVWYPTRPSFENITAGRQHLQQLAERYQRDLSTLTIHARHPLRIQPSGADPRWPLLGTVESVRRGLERFQELDVPYLILDTFYSLPELMEEPLDSIRRTLDTFASQVMPAFADPRRT